MLSRVQTRQFPALKKPPVLTEVVKESSVYLGIILVESQGEYNFTVDSQVFSSPLLLTKVGLATTRTGALLQCLFGHPLSGPRG